MPALWITARILEFFNRVQSVEEITDSEEIRDHDGTGTTIGPTVAARILEKRNSLIPRRFQSLEQLLDVKGLGEDKLQDLIHSFDQHAADAFVEMMYRRVIHDNWELRHHSTYFKDQQEFLQVVENPSSFLDFVARQMSARGQEGQMNVREAQYQAELIRRSYVERFDIEHYGGIEMGFWLYQYDADNWFSFDQVRQVCEAYLSTYSGYENRLELRMVKGYKALAWQATSTTQGIIPVVVNYAEWGISLWSAVLND